MEYILMVLFQYIREHSEQDTNILIAKVLINNINKIKNMNLEEFSLLCSCSQSTAARFFREIGLKNFTHVKEVLNMAGEIYRYDGFNQQKYFENIEKGILKTNEELTKENLEEVIKLIRESKKVVIAGFENHLAITLEFQCRMMIKGKYIEVYPMSFNNSELKKLKDEDLAIIISFHGNYFSIGENRKIINERKGKSILITQNISDELRDKFSKIILCGDNSYYGEEMYSLMYILNSISANY